MRRGQITPSRTVSREFEPQWFSLPEVPDCKCWWHELCYDSHTRWTSLRQWTYTAQNAVACRDTSSSSSSSSNFHLEGRHKNVLYLSIKLIFTSKTPQNCRNFVMCTCQQNILQYSHKIDN